MKKLRYIVILILCFAGMASAQEVTSISGTVVDGDTGEIMEAIRTVAAGGRFVPEDIQVVYERRAAAPEMTERELETLRLAAEGRTNREIAEALGLSEVTVKVRLTGIFAKLGARDRVDAVNRAVARGLVPPRA